MDVNHNLFGLFFVLYFCLTSLRLNIYYFVICSTKANKNDLIELKKKCYLKSNINRCDLEVMMMQTEAIRVTIQSKNVICVLHSQFK